MRKPIAKPKIKPPVKKTPAPKTAKRRGLKKVKTPQPLRVVGLESLKPPLGAHKKKKLLGRGPSSGHGKTSTRGFKGQTSRAGRDFYLGFEGGQTPLIRRIPKRGFSTRGFKKIYQVVNLKSLAKLSGPSVDPAVLAQQGLIKDKEGLVKILGEGELLKPLMIKAHAFSKRAKELIEKSGGKTEILNA